ncbi:SDR family NAD(P)-dependent oxidoreductase [Parerythrobacter lacustris]|uniref:SDR family oxidoreductase n=1 Tax=Parerythrobacter lacustris TaxID=2969984 RepID=A0ABT1XQL6_9SPHN|nr:SDR family oxidoreductase [Parerythrobacter lacustris]MCR2833221.1 SDR family oxidoreductase [Parerythrobacter lacustris]
MTQPARFTGKTVIVTGSSMGIGEAIARRFHGEGANVVLNSRKAADCEAVAATLGGERVLVVAGDVSSSAFAAEIVEKTVAAFGGIDVLVNNAGVGRTGRLSDASDELIDMIIDINLKGILYLTREAFPHLLAAKGNVVNISSVSGLGGDWGLGVYNASKGGVCNLTRAMALEFGSQGVRANAVCPSMTRSDMTTGVTESEAAMKMLANRMPLGRAAEPDEIAGPVLFLASDDAVFVNGVNLPVDGGVTASNGQPNFFG